MKLQEKEISITMMTKPVDFKYTVSPSTKHCLICGILNAPAYTYIWRVMVTALHMASLWIGCGFLFFLLSSMHASRHVGSESVYINIHFK